MNSLQTQQPAIAPVDGIDSLVLSTPPIGTGCMACCSGGVDPTWGGVASGSTVAL